MPTFRSDRTGPDGNRWVRAIILAVFLTVGTGLARTVRGYLSTTSPWDRFVRGPAVLGWLTAFVVAATTLVAMRWIRGRAFCVAAAVVVGAMAIAGGSALGRVRRCDTKSGRALLGEVVALTSVVEPPAVHTCGGKSHLHWPQWTSELSPRTLDERRMIVEFLDHHGLIDLASTISFTASFDVYTIEVDMPRPDGNGEIVVTRTWR